MSAYTEYEWDIEQMSYDDEGVMDIVDHCHADKLSEYTASDVYGLKNKQQKCVLVLVRTSDTGKLGGYERAWAYTSVLGLPDKFDTGVKVPKRFHQELEKWRAGK